MYILALEITAIMNATIMNLEEREKLLNTYQRINQSFKKRTVYYLIGGGFGSKINNMLSCILYCLKHKIQFQLSTYFLPIGLSWKDYFLPFCLENNSHKPAFQSLDYNQLPIPKMLFLVRFLKLKQRKKIAREIYISLDKIKSLFSSNIPYRYIWHLHRGCLWSNDISFPEFGVNSGHQMMRLLLSLVYHHNTEIEKELNQVIQSINIKSPYISVHIRRGNKIIELKKNNKKFTGIEYFIKEIKKHRDISSSIFLATDDYSVVEELRTQLPDYKIYTTTSKIHKGFYEKKFDDLGIDGRRQEIIRLFADLHFMCQGDFFIGEWSSNIGRLVLLFRNCNKDTAKMLDIPDLNLLLEKPNFQILGNGSFLYQLSFSCTLL